MRLIYNLIICHEGILENFIKSSEKSLQTRNLRITKIKLFYTYLL